MTPNNFREKANLRLAGSGRYSAGRVQGTTLNEIHGINLTEDDKVDIQRIRNRLESDESLREVLNADNPRDAKVYKFNQVLDRLLLEFVHTKLDLYKKLTEPKVNEMLKRQWFEVLSKEFGEV